ncbi:hypothetical protein [Salinifilum aidingensis]
MGAILWALGSAAIPAAKIIKLRKFIQHVGSVREAAFLLLRVARGEQQLEELGTVMASLVSEVLGINSIANNCF